jgi:alkanesulfonate monooxygenase SsuD/methylene tetrahydromethanopterin reductase-like flavin-dependent oxidoreductase (luciferase family)
MVKFRFGVSAGANAPYADLHKRWSLVEDLGFENLWVADHTAGFASGGATAVYDGWTTLAAMACSTRTIRIGTLVSNPVLHAPAVLAKQALAVDDLSGGRLELGIGTGIAQFDYDAVGASVWTAKERAARFAEYVEIVASVLQTPGEVSYSGEFYGVTTLASPASVQRPRPPITVGGQAQKVVEVAGRHADRWNTHGPAGADVDEIIRRTERQVATLAETAAANGRDPRSIVLSVMGVQALDVWSRDITVPEIVDRFAPLGFSEFVFTWPGEDRISELERLALDVLPGLRS